MSQHNGNGESIMHIEWTNQHGCGDNDDPNKLNCNIVIQMMCQPERAGILDKMKDGLKTATNKYKRPQERRFLQIPFMFSTFFIL